MLVFLGFVMVILRYFSGVSFGNLEGFFVDHFRALRKKHPHKAFEKEVPPGFVVWLYEFAFCQTDFTLKGLDRRSRSFSLGILKVEVGFIFS